jgi:hypothetical protein
MYTCEGCQSNYWFSVNVSWVIIERLGRPPPSDNWPVICKAVHITCHITWHMYQLYGYRHVTCALRDALRRVIALPCRLWHASEYHRMLTWVDMPSRLRKSGFIIITRWPRSTTTQLEKQEMTRKNQTVCDYESELHERDRSLVLTEVHLNVPCENRTRAVIRK